MKDSKLLKLLQTCASFEEFILFVDRLSQYMSSMLFLCVTVGSLPSEVGLLTQLSYLSVAGNFISGTNVLMLVWISKGRQSMLVA